MHRHGIMKNNDGDDGYGCDDGKKRLRTSEYQPEKLEKKTHVVDWKWNWMNCKNENKIEALFRG